MKIGIMNHPKINLMEEIKWTAENGFGFIDITLEPPGAYYIDIEKTRDSLKYHNLEAVGHTNPFLPYILPLDSIRKTCLDEFKKYVDIFSGLGITLMNIHPSFHAPMFSDEDKIKANITFLKEVARLCKNKGITLMLENFLKPFDNPEVFSRILAEVADLKIHLDVGHCNINQKNNLTEAFFNEFPGKIVHLHFSDNKGENDGHLPLGCGYIDWKNIIKILKNAKYDGTITLEIFTPDRDYVLMSRDKLVKWWGEA